MLHSCEEEKEIRKLRSGKQRKEIYLIISALVLLTDKKENQTFLIYREIQSGAVAKSYMRMGFLIYQEMPKSFPHI
jgi:hypothetical protein